MKNRSTDKSASNDTRLTELSDRLIAAGCFDAASTRYAMRCLAIGTVLSVAFVGFLAEPGWPVRLLLSLLAAFACVQAAFIAHDVGDGALFTNSRVSEGIRQILLTFVCGTSSTYFHHVHRLHQNAEGRRHPDQHGWKRGMAGQCLCRAALADDQIRRGLPARIRQCVGGPGKPGPVSDVLQHAQTAFIAGRANARSGISQTVATNPGGGIIEREIHLRNGSKLFKRTEPLQTIACGIQKTREADGQLFAQRSPCL